MFLFKRNNTYHIYYTDGNIRKSISTKAKTKPEALIFLSNFQENLKLKEKFIPITLSDFRKFILKQYELTKSKGTVKNINSTFNIWIKYFGINKYLYDITNKDLISFLLEYSKSVKPNTLDNFQIKINHFINLAKENNYLPKDYTFNKLKIKTSKSYPLYFSKEDFNKFYSGCNNQILKDTSLLAINTGLRIGEIVSLTWESVDIEGKKIILKATNTKTQKDRIIFLNDETLNLFKALFLKRINDGFVFYTSKLKSINRTQLGAQFKYYCRKVFGADTQFHFHCLRHSFASILVNEGVNLYTVSKLLGHSNISTTQIYSHLENSTLKEATNLLKINLINN